MIIVSAAACSSSSSVLPADAGSPGQDGSYTNTFSSGVGLQFVTDHAFDRAFLADRVQVQIGSAEFRIVDFTLIGDSANGDSRTAINFFGLKWNADSAYPVAFPDAPPGFYAKARGTIASFEIQGRVQFPDGRQFKFEIENRAFIPVELDIGYDLEAKSAIGLEVLVDIPSVLSGIDFESIEVDDNELEIEEDSPQMVKILERLPKVFRVTQRI